MQTLRISIFSCLFFVVFSNTRAQTDFPRCGWELARQKMVQKNPEGLSHKKYNEELLRSSLLHTRMMDDDLVYTLPIVVHVIHNGEAIGSPENPSDAQILTMISGLNKAFRKNGPAYGGADIKLQFQLAVRSPGCSAATGINRVNGSGVPNYTSGGISIDTYPGSADEVAVKALSRWPNTDYINIWIVNKINGSASAGGFAYFAEYNSAVNDGIVLQFNCVTDQVETLTHEMGHYFELYHTFYDDGFEINCPRTDSCAFYGDQICDTEPSKVEYNCTNTTNSCTGLPYIIADATLNYTVLRNYMNYTNCPRMFTQEQKDRMRAALFAFRPGLINSGGLTAAPISSPPAACTPTASFGPSFYYGVEKIVFNTLSVYSNSSVADGSQYIDRSCNQRTSVIKGQNYSLILTGSYQNFAWLRVWLDYNNDGDFNDAGELLLSGYTGSDTVNVSIPLTGVVTGLPLRLRAIADNPTPPAPDPCHINGAADVGAGQVEDFAVIILKRDIISITSGAWNSPTTWSCNCIPQNDDQVTVKPTHTVNITPAMGAVECGKLVLEPGSIFNVDGSFKVNAK
jgi:hypothetical protein